MAKPFLKWAGGKRQLISEIEKRLPSNIEEIETYVEPFIGGGALLFHMLEKYEFEQVYISDINPELVLCYKQLQTSVKDVIKSLEKLVANFPSSTEERSDYFYEVRELWNSNLDIESMSNKQNQNVLLR